MHDRITDVRVVGTPNIAIDPDDRPVATDGTEEIDLSGMFILPGFVDTHLHLHTMEEGQKVPPEYVLKLWLAHGITSGQTVGSVFSAATAFPSLASSTLLQALSLPGGPTVLGMAQNLMRAAVAGVLNAAHPDIAYAVTPAQLINAVNGRLANGNRQAMEALKDIIDVANNAGCPI